LKNGGDAKRKAMLDRFVGAWNAHDLDGIMASLTDDCVFWSSSGAHPQGGVSKTGSDSRSLRRQFPKLPDAAWTGSPDHAFRFRRLMGTDIRRNSGWEEDARARRRYPGAD
jgi:hypothetical protein